MRWLRRCQEQVCALLVTALDGLVTVLEQAPATPLHQVIVLEPAERAQLLAGWNDTATPVPEALVPELIAAQAARAPDAMAVVCGDVHAVMGSWMGGRVGWPGCWPMRVRGRSRSWRLCMERGAELVIAMLGVLTDGGGLSADGSRVSGGPADRVAACGRSRARMLVSGPGVRRERR